MSQTNAPSSAHTSDEKAAAAAAAQNRHLTREEQLHEEWFGLYGQLDEFVKQTPQKHPLYAFAQQAMQKDETCDFYRGNYEALAKCLQFVEVSKNAAAQQTADNGQPVSWEDMYIDMVRLLIGLSMSRALKRWPEENIPKGAFQEERLKKTVPNAQPLPAVDVPDLPQ